MNSEEKNQDDLVHIGVEGNLKILAKKPFHLGAPHHFYAVNESNGDYVDKISFQEGTIEEVGVNGLTNEVLVATVISRLQHFQKGDFNCRENSLALTKLEEAMMWMNKRTEDRKKREVEGKYEK